MPANEDLTRLTAMRRPDRAVEDEGWIRALLHRTPVGVLATAHDGQPFVNSNLFVYEEDKAAIFIHTARQGRTRSVAERNPRGAFTVFEMGRLLPADVALEFSVEYSSVVVFGRLAVVEDAAQASHYLQILLDKYAPHLEAGRDYRPPVPAELRRTTVLRLAISDWSGKQKAVAADFPGAYWYGATGDAGKTDRQ